MGTIFESFDLIDLFFKSFLGWDILAPNNARYHGYIPAVFDHTLIVKHLIGFALYILGVEEKSWVSNLGIYSIIKGKLKEDTELGGHYPFHKTTYCKTNRCEYYGIQPSWLVWDKLNHSKDYLCRLIDYGEQNDGYQHSFYFGNDCKQMWLTNYLCNFMNYQKLNEAPELWEFSSQLMGINHGNNDNDNDNNDNNDNKNDDGDNDNDFDDDIDNDYIWKIVDQENNDDNDNKKENNDDDGDNNKKKENNDDDGDNDNKKENNDDDGDSDNKKENNNDDK